MQHILLLGGSFYLGMLISILLHAQASVSARSNSLESLKEWFSHNWITLFARAITATFLLPLIVKGIPSSVTEALPPISVYGVAGLTADSLLSPVLFLVGQKLGSQQLSQEMPEVSPPLNPPLSAFPVSDSLHNPPPPKN